MFSTLASGIHLEGQSRLQVGNNINVNSAGADCLADLRSKCDDPSDVKRRIEFTKGGLLKASYEWVLPEFWDWHRNSSSRLFWIRGDAGKGKTMLICGIIDELKAKGDGDSIAYFFCQASDSRLQSSTMVLKGLLFSLLVRPRYGHLREYLEVKHNSAGKQIFDDSNNTTFFGLRDVFEKMMHDNHFPQTCLIVDGLDECENGLGELLHLIRETATTCDRIRWVVSSRNCPQIERQLGSVNSAITLNVEKNAENVSQAISHYLDHKVPQLDCIRDNTALQRETKSRLQEKANGTFLWVSLVLTQLESECFLESAVLRMIEDFPPGLWPLFERMMSKLKENRVHFETCRRVLSTATLTNRPLQLQELQFLANVNKTDNISKVVNLCGSFLTSVDGTVSLIHQSAKEYLLDPQRALAEAFPDGLAEVHHRIFVRSLEFMNITLRRDIYGSRRQDYSVEEIQTPDPDPLSEGRYICTFWIDHLIESSPYQLEDDRVFHFLRHHFLHWLESLALLRTFSEGILLLRRLGFQLKSRTLSHPPLVSFLADAIKFSLRHAPIITQYPLQIYHAAIIFSPLNCVIRNQFWDQRPRFLKSSHNSEAEWHLEIARICPDGVLRALSFESGGNTLLCCSTHPGNSTVIRIQKWDLGTGNLTGETTAPFLGHPRSCVFSQDAKLLALAHAETERMRVMEIENPRPTSKLGLGGLWDCKIDSIACLPYGKGFATISDSKLKQWNSDLEEIHPSHQFNYSVKMSHIAFTPDGKTLATAPRWPPTTIYLWNWTFRTELQPLTTNGEENMTKGWLIETLVFSQDGKTLAAAIGRSVRLWDTTTRQLKYVLDHVDAPTLPYTLAFSPDGAMLAVGNTDSLIRLWDISKQTKVFVKMSVAESRRAWWDAVIDVRLLDDLQTIVSVLVGGGITLQERNLVSGTKTVTVFKDYEPSQRCRFLMRRYFHDIYYDPRYLSIFKPELEGKTPLDPEDGGRRRDKGTLSIREEGGIQWVVRRETQERLLGLPPHCRVRSWDSIGDYIVLGHELGKITVRQSETDP